MVSFSHMWLMSFPNPFIRKEVPPLTIEYSSCPCEYSLTVRAGTYFWAVYYVLFIYVSIFMPVSYCFDNHSFEVQFEIRKCDASLYFSSVILAI